jgi:hypothetical protein
LQYTPKESITRALIQSFTGEFVGSLQSHGLPERGAPINAQSVLDHARALACPGRTGRAATCANGAAT